MSTIIKLAEIIPKLLKEVIVRNKISNAPIKFALPMFMPNMKMPNTRYNMTLTNAKIKL